jgi:hypothetical protein
MESLVPINRQALNAFDFLAKAGVEAQTYEAKSFLAAYRTEAERQIFLGWVLTAVTFLTPDGWRDLMAEAGYTGDYSWTVLEADPEWNDFSCAGAEPDAGQRES